MTFKVDVAALAVDSQYTAEEDAMSAPDSRPANVIVLSEDDLNREHLRFEKEEHESSAQHVTGGSETEAGDSPFNNFAEFAGMPLNGVIPKKPLHYRFIKRVFDIVFSACVIVIGFVPGLVLCAFVAKDTGGSPIYRSTRIGLKGKPFCIYKFRTMVADADDLEKHLSAKQLEQWHKEHKVDGDPRITKFGEFLRSSSIDEFPQFLNVFIGQMSTIGSRAITQEELAYFGDYQALLLSQRPGITGMWQCGPRNIATFQSGLRQKIELMYVSNASIKLDTKLFFKTFRTMIERTGQ